MSLNEKFGRNSSNVRKVELHDVPAREMLQKLFSDLSIAAPGTECEVSWQSGPNTFFLTLNYSRQTARANWKLYVGKGLQPRFIWEYTTNDIAIVHQLVLAELQKQARASQSTAAIPALRGSTAPPEEKRAVHLDGNLSSKLRQLFVGAQKDLVGTNSSSTPPLAQRSSTTAAIEYVDLTPGKELLQNLFVNEFGIFSYPTFLFLLEREYYEATENKSPTTLVIFSIKRSGASRGSDQVARSLTPSNVQSIARTIKYTQRKTDYLTQVDENKFAALLPDTNTAGGKSFVSRIQKALVKVTSTPDGGASLKFNFGMATLGEHCKILPDLLYFADKSLMIAQQSGIDFVCDQEILSLPLTDKEEYLKKAIDLAPTRHLVKQLVSAGIFTYPAFLGFLEHEFYRCIRKKRDLFVMLLKVRVRSETFDEATNLLPDQAFYEVIRRVRTLLTQRDVFAHYSHGNFVLMRSNASLSQMQNLAKRIIQSITNDKWLTPECPSDSLRTRVQICVVRSHETSSTLFGFVPAE
jgi:GGDEF domain-containing protein